MMATRLQAIDVEDLGAASEAPAGPTQTQSALTSLLAISLKALSQRALVALASLVDLALIASVFVVWLNMMAQPSNLQLVGGGMYAAFILACLWVRRR